MSQAEKNNPFPNAVQSPEERRLKYQAARESGVHHTWARRIRDFSDSNFNRIMKSFRDRGEQEVMIGVVTLPGVVIEWPSLAGIILIILIGLVWIAAAFMATRR